MPRKMEPDEYREYMREYMKRRYDERMAHAIEYLGGKCADCGSTDSLEIDHIDPATKLFTVSCRTALGLPRFMAEVEKCQLLCGECHQAKTSAEQSVEHGGGLTGKKNCYCDLCAPLKRAYSRKSKHHRKQQLQRV